MMVSLLISHHLSPSPRSLTPFSSKYSCLWQVDELSRFAPTTTCPVPRPRVNIVRWPSVEICVMPRAVSLSYIHLPRTCCLHVVCLLFPACLFLAARGRCRAGASRGACRRQKSYIHSYHALSSLANASVRTSMFYSGGPGL